MRLVIHPIEDPTCEVDVRHALTAAIAEELWRRYGGNDGLNWLEAERHLQRLVGSVRRIAGSESRGERRERFGTIADVGEMAGSASMRRRQHAGRRRSMRGVAAV